MYAPTRTAFRSSGSSSPPGGGGLLESPTHSATLPAMSSAPHGEAEAGRSPASAGPPMPASTTARVRSGGTSPQGQRRPSPPLAATSHSTSLGSLAPAHSQNERASCHET